MTTFDAFFEKYPDFTILERPNQVQIDSYQGVLPDPILALWKSHGWGIFMDGFLRLVDPSCFQSFAQEFIDSTGAGYTPWAVTAFGDLLVSRTFDKYIEFYDYRHTKYRVIGDGRKIHLLFDHKFVDESYIWNELNALNYYEAKARLGTPAYDQCYGYFPLLALGGPESIEHIQLVDLQVHMELMAQTSGPL